MTQWTRSAPDMPDAVRRMIVDPSGTRWRHVPSSRTSSRIVFSDGTGFKSLVLTHEPGDEMSLRLMFSDVMFGRFVTTDEVLVDLLDRPDRTPEDMLAAFIAPILQAFDLKTLDATADAAYAAGVERIERIAAAAMAGSSPTALRFVHLPSPWNGARMALMSQWPDEGLAPEWKRAISLAGKELPSTVNFDVKPYVDGDECRFDVTLTRPSILVRECDALEAMRVAKDLA